MIFCMNLNIKVFYKLVVSFLLVMLRYAQDAQNGKSVIFLQYLKKEGKDKTDFFMQINIKLSYIFMPLTLVGVARPTQLTQDNRFAKPLRCYKNKVRDKVVFFCNEHHSFL